MRAPAAAHVMLYDGECGLCNKTVNFVLKYDKHEQFLFAALQSPVAQQLCGQLHLPPPALDTVVVLANYQTPAARSYTRSRAVMFICMQLGGWWRVAALGYLLPNRVRDWGYDVIAARRIKWFGKIDACQLPTPALARRMLE